MKPKKAFILAAGFGKRMLPLTETCPKPLLRVGEETLLDRALDQLAAFGVEETVINTHYLAETIQTHLQNRTHPKIHLSYEPEILETGGGIKNALSYFDDEPFIVLSGDGYWIDQHGQSELERLWKFWDADHMDILLSLQPVNAMTLTKGIGDYDLDPEGKAIRSHDQTGAYMFNSMRIHHPRIFKNASDGYFSYLELMDQAEKQGRLYGLVHTGAWHHISTPDDLAAVNAAMKNEKTGT